MNIIECTIKMKEQAREHYEQLSQAAGDKDMKRLALLLAAAETELIEKLQMLQGNMEMTASTPSGFTDSVCVFSPRFDPNNPGEELENDPDVYRHIVREEEETLEFFDQLGEQSENEMMRSVFRILADRERDHLARVENIYSFVEDPRTFLEWGEFSNLKRL